VAAAAGDTRAQGDWAVTLLACRVTSAGGNYSWSDCGGSWLIPPLRFAPGGLLVVCWWCLQVHPGSSQLAADEDGLLPEWLIYHEFVATSRPFLRQVRRPEEEYGLTARHRAVPASCTPRQAPPGVF
jgi:hypothetical protein